METIIRFSNVSLDFNHLKTILDSVSFTIKSGMKLALMGQNGAGKSTLFKLITGTLKPTSGDIFIGRGVTIAIAYQTMPADCKPLTVLQYFTKYVAGEEYEVKRRASSALNAVNLEAPWDKVIGTFSGGQQARLLLAAAVVQEPDVLLLDEPTNNLDHAGIEHLTTFLIMYQKSVVVISHDADFLNSFTEGVLYLDAHTQKIETYAGNYHDVVADIAARIEKQNRLNEQAARLIQEKKDNANFFAQKGGKMRNVAKKMYEKIEQLEEEKVEVRREDKTIRPFTIPCQKDVSGDFLTINSFQILQAGEVITKKAKIVLGKGEHLQIVGRNGIGKTTFIHALANNAAPGAQIRTGLRIGYYTQDFSNLNPDQTVNESLIEAVNIAGTPLNEERYRAVGAGFLINKDLIGARIGSLSEGQKGLVAFARLVLAEPGILILDEPTNHINFRHIPRIAEALAAYQGAMVLVSHVAHFVQQIGVDRVLDLEG